MLSVIDNALLQGLGYGLAALGVTLAFRVLRYPDLTADGSFLLGAAVLGAVVSTGAGWPIAMALATLAGAAAGLVTAFISLKAGVNRLLAGILTTMMAYSVVFHVLSGRSNIGLLDRTTAFSSAERFDAAFGTTGAHPANVLISAVIAIACVLLLVWFLRSDFGLLVRGVGGNSPLIASFGRSPSQVTFISLAISNSIIALAGSLIASRQGFADVNMGSGIVIVLIAGLMLGEDICRRFHLNPRTSLAVRFGSPVLGTCIYFFFYLGVLRASSLGFIPIQLQPTDLKFLSALVLVVAIAARRRTGRDEPEEIFPV